MLTQEQARSLLTQHLHEQYLLHHSRETEVIMRALARHFGEDEEFWGLTGLLHDLDMEQAGENYEHHGKRTVEILQAEGLENPEMFQAIQSHCEGLVPGAPNRESRLDFALAAAENLTGIIVAYTLMRPDKSLANVEPKSVTKKIKDKSFAAKVNREFINDIEKTGLQRADFLALAIKAMQEIAGEIGF